MAPGAVMWVLTWSPSCEGPAHEMLSLPQMYYHEESAFLTNTKLLGAVVVPVATCNPLNWGKLCSELKRVCMKIYMASFWE